MKKEIARAISIIVVSVALSTLASMSILNPDSEKPESEKPESEKIEVAGVIRSVDEKGWFVIDDGAHRPLNIAHVEVRDGMILIHYTFKAASIHSFLVTPDETFARAGFFAGASVNQRVAAISISRVIDGHVVPVDASTIHSQLGNFWVYGLFSRDGKDVQ